MRDETLFIMFRTPTNVRYGFGTPLLRGGYEPHLDLEYKVGSLTWTDEGGPSEAEVSAFGNDNELALLAKLVGRPVDIVDQHGTVVWQGRFHSLKVPEGGYVHTHTLDDMANAISLAYYKVASSAERTGVRTQADWVSDVKSQEAYGQMQSIVSRSRMTLDEAASEAATQLAMRKKPAYGVQRGTGFGQDRAATLQLKGEWYYFQRAYYSDSSCLESYETDSPDYSQNFGEGSGISMVMQAFKEPEFIIAPGIPSPTNLFKASQVTLQVGRVVEGDKPNDNVWVEIWSGGWVQVGRLISREGAFPTEQTGGTDAGSTSVWINGYIVGDNKAYIPYFFRAGLVVATLDGSGNVREQIRMDAVTSGVQYDGPGSSWPGADNFRQKFTVTRAMNGTTAQGYAHGEPLYAMLPKTAVASSALIPAASVATSVSELTFTFSTPFDVWINELWIVLKRGNPPNAVASVAVNAGGAGYSSAPAVSFTGGGGTGAAATAVVSGGNVTAINVTNGGSGYHTAPTVVLTGGGGSLASATAVLSTSNRSWIGYGMYQVRMCSARTYARGESYIRVKNSDTGASGIVRTPYPNDGKLWFKVSGTRETTQQLALMASQATFASFCELNGLPTSYLGAYGSQVYTVPYRSGDRSVQEEMLKLLQRGSRDNSPLYAIVKPSRAVAIYREEDASAALLWTIDGRIVARNGSEIPQLPPPVGRWVISEGFLTGTTGPDKDNAFYVKEATYDPINDVLELRARATPPLGQLPGVLDG